LFGVQQLLHPQTGAAAPANRIEVTQDDLRQMSVTWLAQGRPALTAEQWRYLIEEKVHDEVLYREAIAAGLDQGDAIVKRRMVQKMEFLAEDVAAAHEPATEELKAWFAENPARFAVPARITFRHLYFNVDRHGEHTKDDAERARQDERHAGERPRRACGR
jgi:peptidyl-prolyl cis-trans isomerase C